MTISNYAEDKFLNAALNNTSFAVAAQWVKLHTGDPGEAGTANAAGETTRKSASFATASGGTAVSDTDLIWTNVSTTETYTHISIWDASTAGNCLWTGPLVAAFGAVSSDTFQILAGSLTISLD